jgi:hypothetical protein
LSNGSPRLAELWPAIQARIDTPEAIQIMNGGRTFRATENFAAFRGPEGSPWGMQVVKPTATLWPVQEVSDFFRPVGFQVATYMNAPVGYVIEEPIEKLQDIVYKQLHEWTPAANTFKRVLVSFKITRQRPPQAMPEWDADRGLWMLSSDFRTEAASR